MTPLWKRLDIAQRPSPFILDEDEVYYAREYIPGGGFGACEANQFVLNLKKSPDRKGRPEWVYKEVAVRRFADELRLLLRSNREYTFAAIPTSKCSSDPEYDSRLDDVLTHLSTLCPSVIVEAPIYRTRSSIAAHSGGSRTPAQIAAELTWRGFRRPTDVVIFVDDVLTTGAHFRACASMCKQAQPSLSVLGLFWARTVRTH